MTNCSPLSSENHRSLFVKPAKRGKQRAGGEALFPLHLFTFNYQPRHRHNCFISQLRWYCAIVSMDEFRNINVLMVQLGTSCSFDSPGLARNEPTPGEHPQGDSTPSVLSFFCEGTLTMKLFMADYSKKAQHLRRWSTQTVCYPRVACTIVWQPWAIKSATPTALKRSFHNIIDANMRINK